MNSLIRAFDYQGLPVRTIIRNGRPFFVAKDVCDILEITNSRDAVARLDEDEKGVVLTDTPGGSQHLQAVTESGLYTLVLSSRKPEARAFKRWITHEVLPSIRKYGMYAVDELLDNPDLLIRLATKLKNEREQRERLEAENLSLLPKAQFHDRITAINGEMTMEAAAKQLGTGRNRLFRDLRDRKILKSNNLPMQEYLERGYFRVVQNPLRFGGEETFYAQTMVTGKGFAFIHRVLEDKG